MASLALCRPELWADRRVCVHSLYTHCAVGFLHRVRRRLGLLSPQAVRWLWFVTIALGALTVAVDLATDTGTWYANSIGAIALVLLLLPATRRFFFVDETVAAT
jgi:hypothetical protein